MPFKVHFWEQWLWQVFLREERQGAVHCRGISTLRSCRALWGGELVRGQSLSLARTGKHGVQFNISTQVSTCIVFILADKLLSLLSEADLVWYLKYHHISISLSSFSYFLVSAIRGQFCLVESLRPSSFSRTSINPSHTRLPQYRVMWLN